MIMINDVIARVKRMNPHPSQVNMNSNWVNSRGAWVTNLVIIAALRYVFGIIPMISVETAWTLTNVTYLVVSFRVVILFTYQSKLL